MTDPLRGAEPGSFENPRAKQVESSTILSSMSMRVQALAFLILPMTSCAASAQQGGGALEILRQSPTYQSAMREGAYKSGAWLVGKCEPKNPSADASLGMLAAPVFDDKGQPQSGRWVEHVSVEGCGRPWRLNVLMMVTTPGTLATMPMAPGTTRADPVLQRDAATFAFAAARIDPKGCKPIYLADTAYGGASDEPAKIPGKPAWSETWTVAQCDHKTAVAMTFTPDASGVAIVAKLAK